MFATNQPVLVIKKGDKISEEPDVKKKITSIHESFAILSLSLSNFAFGSIFMYMVKVQDKIPLLSILAELQNFTQAM